MISEFESLREFIDAALIVLRFSDHEEVVDIYRDKDMSVV
jgi:hypothetical protein